VAGGRLRNENRDVMDIGRKVLSGVYKVSIGIYGVTGVDNDATLLDVYEEKARARQMIRDNSRSAFLVLDHSKIGRFAHVRRGKVDEAIKIFRERTRPATILALIRQSGARLIICSPK